MAIDLHDCTEEPYGLGECYEDDYTLEPTCDAWANGTEDLPNVTIFMRRRGNYSYILIPELVYKTKTEAEGGTQGLIKFKIEDEKILGKYPHTLTTASVGWNNGDICEVEIEIDIQGNFYIHPADDDEGFIPDGKPAGVFSTLITYKPYDEPEEEEEETEEK